MTLRDDRDALESLPLKLVIVAVVASLSVIPAGQALDGFRNGDFVNRSQLELEAITSTAQMLMMEGPGAVRTLHLDFESSGRLAFDRLAVGDHRGGPNMSAAILHLTSGGVLIGTATEPEVWIRSELGGTLLVTNPRCDICLSVQLVNRTAFVLAEIV